MDEATLVNSLCIEWYGEDGERYVIDSVSFYIYAGEPVWQMDAATEKAQLEANTQRFHSYIEQIANRLADSEDDEVGEEVPMDEFQWELRLQESDRITQAYMEALDKYQDYPDQDNLVAAAMGWGQSSDPPGWVQDREEEDDDFDFDFDPFLSSDDDETDPEPWADADGGEIENHPLYLRAQELSLRLMGDAQELNLFDSGDDEGPTPVDSMVFGSMDLSAKLAGALNGVGQHDPEPGLVVAWLKRALPIVGSALAAAESAHSQGAAPKEWLEGAQKDLFEIRTAILDLIQEFREQLP